MDWAAPEWPLILLAGLVGIGVGTVVCLPIGFFLWFSRRRRRRAHLSLIQEALRGMTACLDQPVPRSAGRHRELVTVLIGLQTTAEQLERDVRPRLTESGAHDVADTLRRTMRALSGNDEQAVDITPDDPATPIGHVPTADSAPQIDDLYAAMADTVAERVWQASSILAHARQLRVVETNVDERLTDAIADVSRAEEESRKLAHDKRFVAALCELTWSHLPVPDDGVPAQATQRQLDRQAVWLAEINADYRAEVVAWCEAALRKE